MTCTSILQVLRAVRTAVLATAVTIPSVALAQGPSLSLEDALRLALRNSPELRAESARRDAATARRRAERVRRLPSLETSIGIQRNPQLGAAVLPAEVFGGGAPRVVRLGTAYESTTDRTLRVPLWNAQQAAAAVAADAELTRAEIALRREREAVIAAVIEAYAEVLLRGADTRAARARAAYATAVAADAAAGLRSGRIAAEVADAASVDSATASLEVERAALAEATARETLGGLIAADTAGLALAGVSFDDSLPALLALLGDAEGGAATPLKVREAIAEERAADAQLRTVRRASLPTLEVVASLTTLGFGDELGRVTGGGDRFNRSSIGIQFTPPTLDFGLRPALRAEARAQVRRAEADRAAVERAAAVEARRARLDRAAAREAVAIERRASELAAKRLAIAERGRAAGRASAVELAAAQRDVAAADASVARATAQALAAELRFRQSVGASLTTVERADGALVRRSLRQEDAP